MSHLSSTTRHIINDETVEIVDSFKFLGTTFTSDLELNTNIQSVLKKKKKKGSASVVVVVVVIVVSFEKAQEIWSQHIHLGPILLCHYRKHTVFLDHSLVWQRVAEGQSQT